MAEEIERIYVIPLKRKKVKSSVAAPTAVKRVRQYLTRHMKVPRENVWIDDSLNKSLWSHGKYKIPSKVRVKAVKFEDGVVEAYLPELEYKKSRREILKEEKAKKEPILKKEEMETQEEISENVSGTEDYEIAPSADGEVKIKKKKAPKEKKEEQESKKDEKTPKKKKAKKEEDKKPLTEKKKPTKKKNEKKPTKKSTKKPETPKEKNKSK